MADDERGTTTATSTPAVPAEPAHQTSFTKSDGAAEAVSKTSEQVPRDAKGKWLPGRCPNPAGRPKGSRSLTTILREILARRLHPEDTAEDALTRAEAFVEAVLAQAESGNATCAKEIWERMDGKVPDRIEAKLGGNWSMEYEQATEDDDTEPQDDAGNEVGDES
jgi:hypothetical protein